MSKTKASEDAEVSPAQVWFQMLKDRHAAHNQLDPDILLSLLECLCAGGSYPQPVESATEEEDVTDRETNPV